MNLDDLYPASVGVKNAAPGHEHLPSDEAMYADDLARRQESFWSAWAWEEIGR